jgi:predicted DNA-binding transcriptional regulator AlpA
MNVGSAAHMPYMDVNTNARRSAVGPLIDSSETARLLNVTVGALAQRRYRGLGPNWTKRNRKVMYFWDEVLHFAGGSTELRGPSAPVPLMRPREVAAWLGITESALAQMRFRGDGPTWVSFGRSVRYERADVEAWLSSRRRPSGWRG